MTPECRYCQAPDVVEGDGPRMVCPRCVRSMGKIAADPWSAHVQVREQLRAQHGTSVDLHGDHWDWIAPWPGAGDMRLVTGGVAR